MVNGESMVNGEYDKPYPACIPFTAMYLTGKSSFAGSGVNKKETR